jgi:ABC-type phosphate transport system substrate-binding protein
MRARKLTVGIGVVAAAMSAIALTPTAAYADYAPSSSDVVGVGSDTLQAGLDFLADGDHLGDPGYNVNKKNKFISIDATADANTRLAYGPQGIGSNSCAPGTGGTAGTGNQNTQHTGDKPCVLNPTVVLRAGLPPIQRPNGSGAGFNLLKADTNTTTGKTINGLVDFARASSARTGGANFDSLQMGNDPLGMLVSSTSTHAAPALSVAQLKSIYNCTVTDWGAVGGTAGNTIKPLIPQLGSGTRSYFLGQIGLTESTLGSCVTAVEENDPEAIDSSGDPTNAIEPMSQSRLYLFQGKLSDGTANGLGGYFSDPSCPGLTTSPAACVGSAATLNPNVTLEKTGTPSDGGQIFYVTRPLYIYFRHADITSTTPFQPGSSLNWVRTMLYNPGGSQTPFLCSGAGQADISAAGIIPACTYTPGGP